MNDMETKVDIASVTSRVANKKKRVVFVNRFYWPDHSATSQLLTDLAEHLVSDGWNVVIVTSRLLYASSENRLPAKDIHEGVEIRRVWTTGFNRKSLIGRAIDFLTFYLSATFALLRLIRRGDIVVAKTDPPLIQIFALLATKIKGGRLVNWCQDLFPEVAFALAQGRKFGLMGITLHRLRNFALSRSQMNVTISNEMSKTLAVQGLNTDRILVVRNWCDPTITPISIDANSLRHQWRLDNHVVLGYSGNLGRAHVPDKLWMLINELAGIEKIRLLFVGGGHGMDWLKKRCHEHGHDHVIFKPYQPRETLSLSLSVPDLHLMTLSSGCQNFLSPSKYYGILASGRPIVFLGDQDCELAEEITKSGYGMTLAADGMQAWRDQILQLTNSRTQLAEMGMKARQAYEAHFASRKALNRWQHVIEQVPA